MERVGLPKNFGVIAPNLYRSALPNQSQIFYLAKHYGINTVIDLTERDRDLVAKACLKAKINHVKIPMIDTEVNDLAVSQALKEVKNIDHAVLIHCWAGKHRTGLISALIQKQMNFLNQKIFKDLFGMSFLFVTELNPTMRSGWLLNSSRVIVTTPYPDVPNIKKLPNLMLDK